MSDPHPRENYTFEKKQIKFCVLGGVFALASPHLPLAHMVVELSMAHFGASLALVLGGVLLWASPHHHWLMLLLSFNGITSEGSDVIIATTWATSGGVMHLGSQT